MKARKQGATAAVSALIRNPLLLLFAEVLGLAAGLAMVLGHNIWLGGVLPVVITALGWLMTIRGAALLALSQDMMIKLFEARGTMMLRHFRAGCVLFRTRDVNKLASRFPLSKLVNDGEGSAHACDTANEPQTSAGA
jgi:hypothetical protein